MAKPLGQKSRLIRGAIAANPDKGDKDLAALLNASNDRQQDGIKVTPHDVASQRLAMRKPGAAQPQATAAPAPTPAAEEPAAGPAADTRPTTARKKGSKPGRKPKAEAAENGLRHRPAAPTTGQAPAATPAPERPDLVEAVTAVKRLVGRFGADTVRGLVDLFERPA